MYFVIMEEPVSPSMKEAKDVWQCSKRTTTEQKMQKSAANGKVDENQWPDR